MSFTIVPALLGTLQGTCTATSYPDSGANYSLSGSGTLTGVGSVQGSISWSTPGFVPPGYYQAESTLTLPAWLAM